MEEEKVLDYLTERKIAFPSEISSNVSISPSHIKILLSSLSNIGLIKTISVGEGLYVLPEMANILRKTSLGKDIVKDLVQKKMVGEEKKMEKKSTGKKKVVVARTGITSKQYNYIYHLVQELADLTKKSPEEIGKQLMKKYKKKSVLVLDA